MRMSRMFSQTLREAPSDVETVSQKLLIRAGFIRPIGSGIFSYLPLAKRSIDKIKNIICQEMNTVGGQEILLPVVQPSDLWLDLYYSDELHPPTGRFVAINNHAMVFSTAQIEVLGYLIRSELRSYKQLPQLLYQFQNKWRDNTHSHGELISAREIILCDGYGINIDLQSLDNQYDMLYQAFQNVFQRCDLIIADVQSNPGIIGGLISHDFLFHSQIGDDIIIACDHCGYSASKQFARTQKTVYTDNVQLPLEKVETPHSKTIDDLSAFLQNPKYRTAKAVFVKAQMQVEKVRKNRFVFAIVRGDMEVNEAKLAKLVNATRIIPATDQEIRDVGAVPGYASPVGLKDVLIIVDDVIPHSSNLVSGANIEGYHFRNVNYGRDYTADIVGDIAIAREGDSCPDCGEPLHSLTGVRVGKMIKLGTQVSKRMGCTYLNSDGKSQPTAIGSYEIEIGRLLACIAEQHHDKYGLIWPMSVAPYQLHFISLPGKSIFPDIQPDQAETLYHKLLDAGIDCLYDDREESPGVKFNDADLIGTPLRITLSERSINNGGVEFKRRDRPEKSIISLDNIIPILHEEIRQ